MPPAPRVEEGSITVLRLYDVAYAIDLRKVEREAASTGPTRIRLRRAKPKAIAFGEPPVELGLGRVTVEARDSWLTADVTARVYDFGAVSLSFRFPAGPSNWEDLADLVQTAEESLSPEIVRAHLERVRSLIGPGLEQPTTNGVEEDYLLVMVRRFDRPITGSGVLAELDLPRLLSGEEQPLSESARQELLRHAYSYYEDDLVALTWDRAFIVEPSGDTGVADVLEVANAQLLELRYYDALLDAELPRMYDRIQRARAALGGLARRRYANLAREIYTRVAEVTEIAERVDNALVVTEDVYLARIYGAALDLFRVKLWNSAVERKLAIMRDAYTALYEDAATARAEYLEAAIVLLIVLEIVLAFFR